MHSGHPVLLSLQDPLSGLKWNDAGDAICVHYPEEFAKKTLPLHFKHSKFASFVRQLHLYGFSKSSPPPPPAHPVHEFRHRHLLRHDLSLARFIRRKVPVQSAAPINIEFQQLSQQVRRCCNLSTKNVTFFRSAGAKPYGASRRDGSSAGRYSSTECLTVADESSVNAAER